MSGEHDWKPGDLALCVKRGEWRHVLTRARSGAPWKCGCIYTVRRFGPCPASGLPTLWFEGYPGEKGCDGGAAIRFRKINPLTKEERDEFLRELDAPVKEPRHA